MVQMELFDRLQISCSRCTQNPALKDILGCGYRPVKESEDDKTGWRLIEKPDGSQEFMSPFKAQNTKRKEGGYHPAYEVGVGDIREEWSCCPRWYWAFYARPRTEYNKDYIGGDFLLSNELPYNVLLRAYKYREKGLLDSLIEPPWTDALITGLDLIDRLEYEKFEINRRERERKNK